MLADGVRNDERAEENREGLAILRLEPLPRRPLKRLTKQPSVFLHDLGRDPRESARLDDLGEDLDDERGLLSVADAFERAEEGGAGGDVRPSGDVGEEKGVDLELEGRLLLALLLAGGEDGRVERREEGAVHGEFDARSEELLDVFGRVGNVEELDSTYGRKKKNGK